VAPDFARTAYSMQGQTLDAAIVDLNFDKRTSPEADILLRYLGGDSVMEDIAAREAAKVAEREARAAATKEARRRAGEDSGRKARKVAPAEHELTKEAKERKHPRKRIQCPSCRIHKEAPRVVCL